MNFLDIGIPQYKCQLISAEKRNNNPLNSSMTNFKYTYSSRIITETPFFDTTF